MNGLEKIVARMEADTQAACDALAASAAENAAAILRDCQAQADAAAQDSAQRAAAQAAAHLEHLNGSSQLACRQRVLAAKQQLIDEAYDACERAGVELVQDRQHELHDVEYVSRVANPLHYPSMYQDLTKGRETEVDYINGYIAKLGRQNDCPCRTHEFLTRGVHLAEMAFAIHNPELASAEPTTATPSWTIFSCKSGWARKAKARPSCSRTKYPSRSSPRKSARAVP